VRFGVEQEQIRLAVQAAKQIRREWLPIPQLVEALLPQTRPEAAQRLLWELLQVARTAQEREIGEAVEEAYRCRLCLVCGADDLLVLTLRQGDRILACACQCQACGAQYGDEQLRSRL